jgi:hypothetical protein
MNVPKDRVIPGKWPRLLAIGAVVATLLAACGYRASEAQFEADVTTHGVPESLLITWPSLGIEACAALKNGQTPRSWAANMAHPPDAIPIEQGLIIIYWAVRDVCADQIGKGIDDSWNDSVHSWQTKGDSEPFRSNYLRQGYAIASRLRNAAPTVGQVERPAGCTTIRTAS